MFLRRTSQLCLLLAVSCLSLGNAFVLPPTPGILGVRQTTCRHLAAEMEPEALKELLQEYLEKRTQLNADEVAKQERGKVIGGTKGNKVLEYISGAPVKAQVIDRIPNVFDYDELTKYGYSSLVTPIMNLGGRRAVYALMEMAAPILPGPPPKLKTPKLVIDRTGEDDKARYTGLKMGQILDDNVMAEALQTAQKKAKQGESLRPKLMEEDFEQPFADKRNVGPLQTPEWTVEKLDEYTTAQGKALSWARRAKLGEFVKDPNEVWDLSGASRVYSFLVAAEIAFAFGKSTPTFLQQILGLTEDYTGLLQSLQVPGLVLAAASIGSAVVCSSFLSPDLNRDGAIWAFKGFMGGPLAIRELKGLEKLITVGEQQEQARQKQKAASNQ